MSLSVFQCLAQSRKTFSARLVVTPRQFNHGEDLLLLPHVLAASEYPGTGRRSTTAGCFAIFHEPSSRPLQFSALPQLVLGSRQPRRPDFAKRGELVQHSASEDELANGNVKLCLWTDVPRLFSLFRG